MSRLIGNRPRGVNSRSGTMYVHLVGIVPSEWPQSSGKRVVQNAAATAGAEYHARRLFAALLP
jgi:hypothetical protein